MADYLSKSSIQLEQKESYTISTSGRTNEKEKAIISLTIAIIFFIWPIH